MTDSLREALEALAASRESTKSDHPNDYFVAPYELRELLAAHPAVPAEPVEIVNEWAEAERLRETHKPFSNDGVLYCGWATDDRIVDGCGELFPCTALRIRPNALARALGCGICDGLPGKSSCRACEGTGRVLPAIVDKDGPRDASPDAMPAVPRTVDRPLLDRDDVASAIDRNTRVNSYGEVADVFKAADAVLELARPMPTQEVLDELVYDELLGEGVGVYPGTTAKVAARILALLGGVDESTPAQRALADHFNPAGIACESARVDESTAAEREAERQRLWAEIQARPDCRHGYRSTDSCPGCDADEEVRVDESGQS